MSILLSLIICIIGGLLFLYSTNERRRRLGEIAFAIGLFIFLWIDFHSMTAYFGVK